MREWSDDDLILHFYGEHPESVRLAADVETSPQLRDRMQALERVLSAITEPAPERDADYGEGVWRRIEPELARRRSPQAPPAAGARTLRGPWQSAPKRSWLALAATLALALIGAYLLGRTTALDAPSSLATAETPLGFSEESRQRILMAAVAHHLEQAEVLLVGIANHGPEPAADFEAERARAEELASANRLYRSAAQEAGEPGLLPLLADLEILLLELAHAPATAADLSGMQDRLRERDLLFKLRVVETRLHQQLRPARPRPGPGARA